MAVKLTTELVKHAKPEAARREIGDALVPGLYLVVQPSGAKSWAVRYRSAGKPVKVTLGPVEGMLGIKLADARDQAREVLEKLSRGEDPAREKRETKAIRFTAAATPAPADMWEIVRDDYVKRDASSLRSGEEIRKLLERETKEWNGRSIASIGRRDVIALLDRIVDRGSPVTANRTLAYVRRVFNWARGRGVVGANPCEGIEKPGAETARDRVLSAAEVQDLWAIADRLAYPFGPMVRLLLVTGQRLREVAEAKWGEIDTAARLWTIPADRAKNAAAHEVPLSDLALEILAGLPRLGPRPIYVLTTNGERPVSGYGRAKERADTYLRELDLERAGRLVDPAHVPARAHWTFHDLRRTVATNMAAEGVMFEVIERVLNHKGASGSGLRAVYNRHSYLDEKRAALEKWASRISAIVNPPR